MRTAEDRVCRNCGNPGHAFRILNSGWVRKQKRSQMESLKLFPRRAISALFVAAMLAGASWAAPVVDGVGNFQKVDEHVYRGAQPTPMGFSNLNKLGIKVVVDLREP